MLASTAFSDSGRGRAPCGRRKGMTRFKFAAPWLAVLFLVAATHGSPAQTGASANDTARYLAGLAPAADSPLARFTADATWRQHAKQFDAAWNTLEKQQLSKVRAWSQERT
jgi:hypothetical protein